MICPQKEKDLELTAHIGKELLATIGQLEARVADLEGELRNARDHVTQLRHELNAKSDLLQVNFSFVTSITYITMTNVTKNRRILRGCCMQQKHFDESKVTIMNHEDIYVELNLNFECQI